MILKILEELEATTSRNDKVSILRRNQDNVLLKEVLVRSMDPYVTYHIAHYQVASLPSGSTRRATESDFRRLFDLLGMMASRKATGMRAVAMLDQLMFDLGPLSRKWFSRIVLKDLRIGASASTVNKVWPGLVPEFGVQLAHVLKPDTKVRFPVLVEPKLDGLRLVAVKKSGKVTLFTRKGFEVETLPDIEAILTALQYDDLVLDGEVMGADWNESQSVVASTVNKVDSSVMRYNVFDAVKLQDWEAGGGASTLKDRKSLLKELVVSGISESEGRVVPVPGTIADTIEDVMAAYGTALSNGFEGAMVKDLDAPYEFKRTKSVLKVKPSETWTGTVIGLERGTGKYEGKLGALIVDIGGTATRVGTGLSDAQRAEIDEDVVGRHVEVKGQGMTEAGKVRFPVFIGFRSDKDL